MPGVIGSSAVDGKGTQRSFVLARAWPSAQLHALHLATSSRLGRDSPCRRLNTQRRAQKHATRQQNEAMKAAHKGRTTLHAKASLQISRTKAGSSAGGRVGGGRRGKDSGQLGGGDSGSGGWEVNGDGKEGGGEGGGGGGDGGGSAVGPGGKGGVGGDGESGPSGVQPRNVSRASRVRLVSMSVRSEYWTRWDC